MTPPPSGGEPKLQLFAPRVQTVWNSTIPLTLNDGAMWAGRGINMALLVGGQMRYGRFSVVLAPEFIYSQNREFLELPQALQQRPFGRSIFSFPFQVDSGSIDLPIRFGDKPYAFATAGQSSASFGVSNLVIGAATESQWWGPGIQNAMLLSNNAGGFPHLFARTRAPFRTPIGLLEAKWIIGGISESLFFDTVTSNDLRALNGVIGTVQPIWEPNLTLGAARVVYSHASNAQGVLSHGLDVLTQWPRRSAPLDSTWNPQSEQISSLFGRWLFPRDGFDVFAEWARFELPTSVRDAFNNPGHSQGYTLGAQWTKPIREHSMRLQAELTYLEKNNEASGRPAPTSYASRAIAQGYSHRGQILGASIGPGSSSQWAALDYYAASWDLGVSLNRIRWQTDSFYTSESPNPELSDRTLYGHDVSVLAGFRAGRNLRGFRVEVDVIGENRLNYLFQNPDTARTPATAAQGATDVKNYQVRLQLSPVWISPRR